MEYLAWRLSKFTNLCFHRLELRWVTLCEKVEIDSTFICQVIEQVVCGHRRLTALFDPKHEVNPRVKVRGYIFALERFTHASHKYDC